VVLVDGRPVRSCITFAVACDGQSVTTIEGYRDDPVMSRLRAAFTAHHALQCGYCTPGMLASARDIVLRLPQADERRVRAELSGNLCRCTGYQGIVDAVLSVLRTLRDQPDSTVEALRAELAAAGVASAELPSLATLSSGVAPSAAGSMSAQTAGGATVGAAAAPAPMAPHADAAVPVASTDQPVAGGRASGVSVSASMLSVPPAAALSSSAGEPAAAITEQFDLAFPADQVWALMSDPARVAACLPGAYLSGHEGERVTGGVNLRFGPMQARFEGEARLELRPGERVGRLLGRGRDRLTQSRAEGDIGWRVNAIDNGASRVTVEMRYSLQGPFAQFSRGGLVQEFVRRIVREFADNLARALEGPTSSAATVPASAAEAAAPAVNPLRILFAVLWSRLRRMFGARD
jgi:carbon-monoxide dehydrogenase small subunit